MKTLKILERRGFLEGLSILPNCYQSYFTEGWISFFVRLSAAWLC